MDTQFSLQPEMTVEDLLNAWPSAYAVFMNGKADCIGCFLQKFCTLREVAEAYRISLRDLTDELESHVRTNK